MSNSFIFIIQKFDEVIFESLNYTGVIPHRGDKLWTDQQEDFLVISRSMSYDPASNQLVAVTIQVV
jgi:hypothetical protein